MYAIAKRLTYKQYCLTIHWQEIRRQIFKKRGHRCQICGLPKGRVVHHLTYENLYDEKDEDLLVVCPLCHLWIHTYFIVPGAGSPNYR